MTNMELKVEKDAKGKPSKLTIEIDLAIEGEESKSGKSIIIATSGGNQNIPGFKDVKLGLNLYKVKNPSKSTAFQSKQK